MEEKEEIVEGEEEREEEEENEVERELNALKNTLRQFNWEFDEEDCPLSDPMRTLEIASLLPSEMASLTATSLLKEPYSRPDSPDSGIDAGELEEWRMC